MKHAVIIADSDPRKKIVGGVGIYSKNLAVYLASHGYKVSYVGKEQAGSITEGVPYQVVCIGKPEQSNLFFLASLYRLKNAYDSSNIIHAQRPDWLIPFTKSKARKIVTLHGSHRKNVYLKKGKIAGTFYSYLEKKGLEAAHRIICVSDETKREYSQLYPGLSARLVTIPIGIDLERYSGVNKVAARKKYGFGQKDKVIAYAGRLEKEKNLELLISACPKGVKLFLVGSGRDEGKLRRFAIKMSVTAIFHPPVENKEIPQVLACADVVALTSHYEGLPTLVLESMAAGVPVVTTVGGLDKVIENGKTGYICSNDFKEKLSKAILSRNMKTECILKARSYDFMKIGKKVSEVYNASED
jgi:glycosyltransferase involved in cell wall biosynthesis